MSNESNDSGGRRKKEEGRRRKRDVWELSKELVASV